MTKQEKKQQAQKKTEELITSKTFLFSGNNAFPQSGRSVSILSGANTMKITPELFTSNLPFFGTSTRPSGYGTDNGMKFEGKPDGFVVEKVKKGYDLKAEVKTTEDNYRITMTISLDGYASLSIFCNNRSSMTYSGTIGIIEADKKK